MLKFIKRTNKKIGQVPGTLTHVGEKRVEKVTIQVIDYDLSRCEEKEVQAVEDCFSFKDSSSISWINVNGLNEVGIIEKLGTHFDLHPLVLEDIAHTGQRPKMEDFENYVFVVLRMLSFSEKGQEVKAEQVSFILGNNIVISFQETDGDVFNPVRERIRKAKGRIRKMGADYLLYALVDAVVDAYFIILEKLDDNIEVLEESLMSNPTQDILQKIHDMRGETIFLRKSVWPIREVIRNLENGEPALVSEKTSIYFRDVHDHTVQVIETIETCHDLVAGLHDLYLSAISNRMNEIMKVLTIIATIFIPLTFIAGIYGMNFEYMPELGWRWSYPVLLSVLILFGGAMFFYFKKKKWV